MGTVVGGYAEDELSKISQELATAIGLDEYRRGPSWATLLVKPGGDGSVRG